MEQDSASGPLSCRSTVCAAGKPIPHSSFDVWQHMRNELGKDDRACSPVSACYPPETAYQVGWSHPLGQSGPVLLEFTRTDSKTSKTDEG